MNKFKEYVIFSSDLHGNLKQYEQLIEITKNKIKEKKFIRAIIIGGKNNKKIKKIKKKLKKEIYF
jgi:fatty acid-binding protein DegV